MSPLRVVLLRSEVPEDDAYLRRLADEVRLILYAGDIRTPPPDAPYRTRLFPTLRITGPSHVGWWLLGLARAFRADAPDLVHVMEEPWSFNSLRAARYARSRRPVRLVLHGNETIWWHGSLPERMGKRLFSRYTLGRADAFAAQGPLGVQRAITHGFPFPGRTAVIHTNPRNPGVFKPLEASARAQFRKVMGLQPAGLAYGFAGRLVEEKGVMLFLDAWDAARTSLPAGSWAAVAGSGPLEQPARDRAREIGVTFLGELTFPEEVARFWGCMDIAVVPSWTTGEVEEQGPRVVFEAMLTGCPVVGADSGAIPHMMGDLGVVFRQRDAVDLARALKEVAAMAANETVRTAARERACAHYSDTVTRDRLLALWDAARGTRASRIGGYLSRRMSRRRGGDAGQ